MRQPTVHKLRHTLPWGLSVSAVSECGIYLMDENSCRTTWRGVTCKNCLRVKRKR